MSSESVTSAEGRGEAAQQGESGLGLRYELGIIGALWAREMLRLRREKSRWFGVVLQPLLFWAILGGGLRSYFTAGSGEGGEVDYMTWFFPGILMMIVLFTTIFATISVIEDRQSGFLQGVLVAPGSRVALVLGKVAGVTTLVGIQLTVFLAVAPLGGVDLGAVRWLYLAAVVVTSSVALTAANLVLAWRSSSAGAYHAVMGVVTLPLWVVSGAMFPVGDGALGVAMRFNPMTYMVTGAREAMGGALIGWSPGAVPVLAALIAFATGAVLLAARACRR